MKSVSLDQLYKWLELYYFTVNDHIEEYFLKYENNQITIMSRNSCQSWSIHEAEIDRYGIVYSSNGTKIVFFVDTDPRVIWD